MKNRARHFIATMCLLAIISARAQTVSQVFSNSGIWADYGTPVSPRVYPEFKGRLVNINWADFEVAPNVWDWTIFDKDINDHIIDSMPVTFLVYTRMNAPDWIFSNGVPKVNETNGAGVSIGYSPYYLDSGYNVYFKRMITKVREHVQAYQPSIRNQIVGVQACFGSTGDRIAYKGQVAKQYEISDNQFDSLFKVYSLYYYNEYKNVTPKITMMTNADYQFPDEYNWIRDNCPGGWMKCPTMAKSFQMNMELDKMDWLYDMLNKPQTGEYVKGRCEIWGDNINAAWWTKKKYKNMFTVMTYCINWGLDWPNETTDIIQDPKYDSAFRFFNKYAGQKVPGLAKNAMCALKDVLDASDTDRFPEATFGTADRMSKTRYTNIYNQYLLYGAKLEDLSIIGGSEYDCIDASGTNDVGWRLLPGNYERYLHQIDANITSAGYWNVDDLNQDAMYGRFARGFDLEKGKDALYFDIEDGFLRSKPLNGAYPATIEITYYDNGTGSWQLFYDAQSGSNKASVKVTCGDTKTWKKTRMVLSDAYFGNRGLRGADFYIKNTGSANVMFSVVELSRPQQSAVGFVASPLPSFDTVCINGVSTTKSFVLNGAYLNGTNVQVGPLNGYTFSTSADGPFSSTLTFNGYSTQINSTIYVKINTAVAGVLSGNIPINGGGVATANVSATATVMNTSPVLIANVTPISCYNKKDGAIDLQPAGGIGPFAYNWTNDVQQYWDSISEDVSGLQVANYTVVVNSFAGCATSATFSITQPGVLVTNVAADSVVLCRGGTTTVKVSATGGTLPYSGAGTFTMPAGYNTYTVTDARGCSDAQGFTVGAGTLSPPSQPNVLNYDDAYYRGICEPGNYDFSTAPVTNATSYTWTAPLESVVLASANNGLQATYYMPGYSVDKTISVKANNACGSSNAFQKTIKAWPVKPDAITSPSSVYKQQTGVVFSVKTPYPGVKYFWTVPAGGIITSGQNTASVTVTWGNYAGYINVKSQNDCASSYTIAKYISITALVDEETGSSLMIEENVNRKIFVIPNPVNDIATVQFYAENAFTYSIEISDARGKMLQTQRGTAILGANTKGLNVQHLSAGQYFITLINDRGEKQTIKLLKL